MYTGNIILKKIKMSIKIKPMITLNTYSEIPML